MFCMQYSIHTDGGSRGNPGEAAIGVVIENTEGKVWELAKAIGVTTNNIAEYTAVVEALEHSLSLIPAPTEITFYLDSLLVVQQLSRRYKINNENLKILATKAWSLIATLTCPVTFTHVLRHKNKDADALVNEALDSL